MFFFISLLFFQNACSTISKRPRKKIVWKFLSKQKKGYILLDVQKGAEGERSLLGYALTEIWDYLGKVACSSLSGFNFFWKKLRLVFFIPSITHIHLNSHILPLSAFVLPLAWSLPSAHPQCHHTPSVSRHRGCTFRPDCCHSVGAARAIIVACSCF